MISATYLVDSIHNDVGNYTIWLIATVLRERAIEINTSSNQPTNNPTIENPDVQSILPKITQNLFYSFLLIM